MQVSAFISNINQKSFVSNFSLSAYDSEEEAEALRMAIKAANGSGSSSGNSSSSSESTTPASSSASSPLVARKKRLVARFVCRRRGKPAATGHGKKVTAVVM